MSNFDSEVPAFPVPGLSNLPTIEGVPEKKTDQKGQQMNDVTKALLEALMVVTNDLACLIEESGKNASKDRRIKIARAAIARAESTLAEPQPDADGWIPWAGGECPLGPETIVDVKLKDRGPLKNWFARQLDWRHSDPLCDHIIAYLVVKS